MTAHQRAFGIIACALVAIDQLTKQFASHLSDTVLVHTTHRWYVLVIIPAIWLALYIVRNEHKGQTVAMGMLVAGVIGNMSDVALFGGAVDWIAIGSSVANLADFFGLGGMLLYIGTFFVRRIGERGIIRGVAWSVAMLLVTITAVAGLQVVVHPSTDAYVRPPNEVGR